LSAGTIALESTTSKQQFLFDTTDLYPGRAVEGCVELDYLGSIPGTIRLFAMPATSTGLDRFIDFEVAVSDSRGGCVDEAARVMLFDGRLDRFWRAHDRYANGLILGEEVESGSRISVHARAELADDNDAQGRTIDFSMLVEVRP
jgi:hypothetical protein